MYVNVFANLCSSVCLTQPILGQLREARRPALLLSKVWVQSAPSGSALGQLLAEADITWSKPDCVVSAEPCWSRGQGSPSLAPPHRPKAWNSCKGQMLCCQFHAPLFIGVWHHFFSDKLRWGGLECSGPSNHLESRLWGLHLIQGAATFWESPTKASGSGSWDFGAVVTASRFWSTASVPGKTPLLLQV